MYCTRCGAQNPADANFCARCGHPLQRGDVASTTSRVVPEQLLGEEATPAARVAGIDVPELDPDTALLVAVRGPNEGARFLLDCEEVTCGRHPDSDIFLDDITVSRRHATFARLDSGYAVHDAGSLNGTYVNGERVDERGLVTGDEVQVGRFKFVAFVAGRER